MYCIQFIPSHPYLPVVEFVGRRNHRALRKREEKEKRKQEGGGRAEGSPWRLAGRQKLNQHPAGLVECSAKPECPSRIPDDSEFHPEPDSGREFI